MDKFKSFQSYTYSDKEHPHVKTAKSAAYEAKTSLQRRGVSIKDHSAFIKDMHDLLMKHTDMKDKLRD